MRSLQVSTRLEFKLHMYRAVVSFAQIRSAGETVLNKSKELVYLEVLILILLRIAGT